MKYLDKQKDWKYYAKSSAVTFGAVFLPTFATLVASYDLSGISVDQVSVTAVSSAVVTVLRLVLIASAIAGQKLLLKFKK